MPLRRTVLALAIALAGCHDSTGLDRGLEQPALVGSWNAISLGADSTTYQTNIIFAADQRFIVFWRATLPVSAHATRALADTTTVGTYEVRGDSVFMRTMMVQRWDRVVGYTDSTVSSGGPFGPACARFQVRNDTLVLHVVSFHADAAVESIETFNRVIPIYADRR